MYEHSKMISYLRQYVRKKIRKKKYNRQMKTRQLKCLAGYVMKNRQRYKQLQIQKNIKGKKKYRE